MIGVNNNKNSTANSEYLKVEGMLKTFQDNKVIT